MSKDKKGSCIGRILALSLFALNVIFMLALFLSKTAWVSPPSGGLFFPFLGLVYPFWLGVNCFSLLFWLVLRKRLFFLVQLLVLILCWSTIHIYCPIHFKTPEKDIPASAITVLTYNVDAFESLKGDKARTNPLFAYVKGFSPDIICFQEFYVKSKKDKNDIISLEEVKGIFEEFQYVAFQKNYVQGNSENGLLVLSKFPINEIKKIELWSTFNGAMICQLNVAGKSLCLVNVHLESNRITATDKELYKKFIKQNEHVDTKEVGDNIKERMKRGYEIREKQVNVIHDVLEKINSNYTIICGDFNDTPISYTYHEMSRGLKDSFVESGNGIGITFTERLFPFRIDYILHSPNIKSYNTVVGNKPYSDHYPVITKLKLD